MAIHPSGRRLIGFSILVLLVAGGIWGLIHRAKLNNQNNPQAIQPAGAGGAGSTGPDSTSRADPDGSTGAAPAARAAAFANHLAALAAATSAEEARTGLEVLRDFLKSLPPEAAAALIRDHLATGDDADLPLPFKIGTGGFLATPPTIRVALLDFLGWLHPHAAAELGREILATPTAANEWAVSLRNVARLNNAPADREFLRKKTEELIRHSAWQETPSIGYLNAFDVLVHTEATASTPLLSSLIQRRDRPDLAHAGFLTLDRLTQREPAAMLAQLADDRALHRSRPEMVAQQFARADLRNATQRKITETWLLDPSRTPIELRTFSTSFPNNNQILSTNLLTTDLPLSGAELRSRESIALRTVAAWKQDPRFRSLTPHLDAMAQRLRLLGNQ